MKVLIIILMALALVLLLRGMYYFLTLLTRKKNAHTLTLKLFPWVEVLIWTAFLFWSISYLFFGTMVYQTVIVSLIIIFVMLAGWFIIRDFVSGAVMRSDHTLERGVSIKTEKYAGKISSLGIVSLELITAEGEKLRIPYSKIAGEVISRHSEDVTGKNQVVTVRIPQQLGAENIDMHLRKKLLEMPWIIAEGDIKIHLTPREDHYDTEIRFTSIKEDMFAKTEELIRMHVSELKKDL